MCRALFPRVTHVRILLIEQGTHRVQGFISSGDLCLNFSFRTRHTQCVALYFLGWIMSDLCLYNEVYTVCIAIFPEMAYVGSSLTERGIHKYVVRSFPRVVFVGSLHDYDGIE